MPGDVLLPPVVGYGPDALLTVSYALADKHGEDARIDLYAHVLGQVYGEMRRLGRPSCVIDIRHEADEQVTFFIATSPR